MDDYIDCGNISALNGVTEATWMGWFNRSGSGTKYLMSTYGTGQIQFFVLQGNNYITAYAGNSVGAQVTMSKANVTSWTTGQWYHFAFVYDEAESSDADKMKIYIDGVLQTNAVAGAALTSLNSSTASFEIGKLGGYTTNEFNGKIDEVAVFTSAKTQAEITSIYNSGVPTTITGAVAHWRMGENATFSTNWTVPDQVGSNDGISANMTIEDRVGEAPNSSNNSLSYNMDEVDRESDTP